ncbi:hypothetical protein K2173_024662 [Erythroxylum novogranatense]|uniref:2-oxoglutarate-dependent dioxygenase DAO n=1 Tax=Erythroxylum novogranatense TaxID=1862640 RepID=A0AAV8SV01_9ROSI|nr:hypothetical protein K2173_024662 [Erythroxylum novogranatense]
MNSQIDLDSIPIIDFYTLNLKKTGTPEWNSAKSQVRKALEDCGCFEASFNRIPPELRKATFGALKEFFDLPLETKKLTSCAHQPLHGYLGQYPQNPLFESIGIYDATSSGEIENFTNIMWPEGNPYFSKTVQTILEILSDIEGIIRTVVVESLGLEVYLEEHMNSTKTLLRLIKYKEPRTTEKTIGLGTHTDKSVITLNYQNQVHGLEVKTKEGKWINVKPSPNSVVVICGESLNAWSNGRLHCPEHRCMMSGNETRYAVALFSFFKAGYIVKVPEELVDAQHPLLFKPFDYSEYLKFRQSKASLSQMPLKAYCGTGI